MRRSGEAEHARGLGLGDHVCWGFTDRAELVTRCCEFLVDGVRLGQRVSYVGDPGDRTVVRDELRRVARRGRAGRRAAVEAVEISSLDDVYPAGTVIEPTDQVAAYATATVEARRAGYTGLRVAAAATPLVRTSRQRDAFTRYEHLVDRYMRDAPFAALCAYDRLELGASALAELACMHPVTSPDTTRFQLHAGDRDDCSLAVSGELDLSTQALFALAMERARPRPRNGELAVDARGLAFIDHRHLLTLAAAADRHGAKLVLHGPPPGVERIVDALGLSNVRVETA